MSATQKHLEAMANEITAIRRRLIAEQRAHQGIVDALQAKIRDLEETARENDDLLVTYADGWMRARRGEEEARQANGSHQTLVDAARRRNDELAAGVTGGAESAAGMYDTVVAG